MHNPYELKNYRVTIDNILTNHPERVMVYTQRGIHEKWLPNEAYFFKVEFFIIIKTKCNGVSDEFLPSENIVNLYRSLDRKLPFNLFAKYVCVYHEPLLTNEIYANFDINGVMLHATSIHEWAEYIPNAQKTNPKENFSVDNGNSLYLKVTLADFGIDYTP